MPNFTAPTLIGNVSTAGEIRQDLNTIQTALINIQNAIPSVGGSGGGSANLTAIERILTPDGMIGVNSFVPTFSTDFDSIVVSNNQEGDVSSCMIFGLYHQTTESFEREFSDFIVSDGTYPCVLGVKSLGYPSLSVKCLIEDTDQDIDLVLYRFDVVRSGSVFVVRNLRRQATVLIDRGSFAAVFDQDIPLVFGMQGSIGAGAGWREAGVVAPWDLEVAGAYARLGTAPTQTDGIEIEIRRAEGTDAESVLATSAVWSNGQSGDVVQLSPNSPMTQVSAGEFMRVFVTVGEAAPVAADLYVTLLCRRIYHGIYR
jgi:outer membrane lipoprotein SlyB